MGNTTNKGTVTAWAFWDWGSAAFNAVVVTFIYSVYLVDVVGRDIGGPVAASSWYSWAMAAAGIAIALFAPVAGRRADALGRRRRSMSLWTVITVALMAALALIAPEPGWFWPGVVLMAVASVTFQFAEVSYFAMLPRISTDATVGRVSGFGWSMGYFGGIVLLLASYVGFIADGGALGLPTSRSENVRAVALLAAAWFLISALPAMLRLPESEPRGDVSTPGLMAAYTAMWRDITDLWRADRRVVHFLIASAIFRDGLAGVFTFGAILAVTVYGLDSGDVLIFGVAANVVAALGALVSGWLDDKAGPKPVIMWSLALMVIDAAILLVVSGPAMFWIFGLVLCLFVGPAQTASRTFMSRLTPEGYEGQMFGLYTTVGRAVSWLSPLFFGAFVAVSGTDRAGIAGIGLVLAVGFALMLRVPNTRMSRRWGLRAPGR